MRMYTMSAAAIAARIKGGKAATAGFVPKVWMTTKVLRDNYDWARENYGSVNGLINLLRVNGSLTTNAKSEKGTK